VACQVSVLALEMTGPNKHVITNDEQNTGKLHDTKDTNKTFLGVISTTKYLYETYLVQKIQNNAYLV